MIFLCGKVVSSATGSRCSCFSFGLGAWRKWKQRSWIPRKDSGALYVRKTKKRLSSLTNHSFGSKGNMPFRSVFKEVKTKMLHLRCSLACYCAEQDCEVLLKLCSGYQKDIQKNQDSQYKASRNVTIWEKRIAKWFFFRIGRWQTGILIITTWFLQVVYIGG